MTRRQPWRVIVLLMYWSDLVTSNQSHESIETVLSLIKATADSKPPTSGAFVTLAFAQSLDGKIAQLQENGAPSSNLAISGPESLVLTHGLRNLHDGILIGRTTLEADSPRLTNRLYTSRETHQPRPIVLDPKNIVDEVALQHFHKRPILVVANERMTRTRRHCDIVGVKVERDGGLDLQDLLHQLQDKHGLNRIMVEGGAATLRSFLRHKLIDCITITVNPELALGRNGISALDDSITANQMRLIHVARIGKDLQLTYLPRK